MTTISAYSAASYTPPAADASAQTTVSMPVPGTRLAQAEPSGQRGPSVITIPGLTPGASRPLEPSVYGIGGSFPVGLDWLIDKVGLDNVLRVLPPQVRSLSREALNKLSVRIGVLPGVPPEALRDPSRLPKDFGVFVSVSLPGYPVAYAMVINPGKGSFLGGVAKIWPVGGLGSDGMPNVLIFNNTYAGFTGLGTSDLHARHMPGYVAVLGRIPYSSEAAGLLANGIRALGTVGEAAEIVGAPETGGASLAAMPWVEALKQIVAGTVESGTYYAGIGYGASTEVRDLNDWRFNLGGRLVKPEQAIPELMRQWNLHGDEAAQLSVTGRYLPGAALRRVFRFDPRYTNIAAESALLQKAITLAIDSGSTTARAVGEQWAGVLEGRTNAGLTGRDLRAGKLLAAVLLGRQDDVRRLTEELYPPGQPPTFGGDGYVAPVGLERYAVAALSGTPVGQVVAGMRVFDAHMVARNVGAPMPDGARGGQGVLMRGRTAAGAAVYWLQGRSTNYLLRNTQGQLVATDRDATQRARELIANGGATDLEPLDIGSLPPRHASTATGANTDSVGGLAIVGGRARIGWVGAKPDGSQTGRQGLLMWGRTPSGEAVFWLQGRSTNYLLRDDTGALVRNHTDAIERARAMIRFGGATDLDPL